MSFESVPIVDVSALIDLHNGKLNEEDIQVVNACQHLVSALRDVGFAQVIGHQVNLQHIKPMLEILTNVTEDVKMTLAKRSFAPKDESIDRKSLRPIYRGYFPVQPGETSYKEGFDSGSIWRETPEPQTQSLPATARLAGWPLTEPTPFVSEHILEGWKAHMQAYYDECMQLGLALLDGLAMGLGLGRNTFSQHFIRDDDQSVSTLRILRYPKRPLEDQQGLACSKHTDSGVLTLLYQDDVGGLEALNANEQIVEVPPIEGALVINAGDLLAMWTNGIVRATVHQVRAPTNGVERFSVPFFLEPGYNARLFDDVIYGPWVTQKMAREFAEFRGILDEL